MQAVQDYYHCRKKNNFCPRFSSDTSLVLPANQKPELFDDGSVVLVTKSDLDGYDESLDSGVARNVLDELSVACRLQLTSHATIDRLSCIWLRCYAHKLSGNKFGSCDDSDKLGRRSVDMQVCWALIRTKSTPILFLIFFCLAFLLELLRGMNNEHMRSKRCLTLNANRVNNQSLCWSKGVLIVKQWVGFDDLMMKFFILFVSVSAPQKMAQANYLFFITIESIFQLLTRHDQTKQSQCHYFQHSWTLFLVLEPSRGTSTTNRDEYYKLSSTSTLHLAWTLQIMVEQLGENVTTMSNLNLQIERKLYVSNHCRVVYIHWLYSSQSNASWRIFIGYA